MRTKRLIFAVLAVFVVLSVVASAVRLWWPASQRSADAEPLPDALIVYCFHPSERCANCDKIESYTREVLAKSFAVPLKEGRLVWRVRNFELPENAHFADDYQILASCIVLVDARSGHAGAWKNLQQKAWELVGDKQAFLDFVRGEIQEALK
jgi:hypothetical protein